MSERTDWRAPDTTGSFGRGVRYALVGSTAGHFAVGLGFYWLRYAQHQAAGQGDHMMLEWKMGDEFLVAMANPGLTQFVWAPFVALAVRERPRTLQGFLIVTGVVFLLNTACWGVLGALLMSQ